MRARIIGPYLKQRFIKYGHFCVREETRGKATENSLPVFFLANAREGIPDIESEEVTEDPASILGIESGRTVDFQKNNFKPFI